MRWDESDSVASWSNDRNAMKGMAYAILRKYTEDHWNHKELKTWANPKKLTWGYQCDCREGDHPWSCEWAMKDFKTVTKYMRANAAMWGVDHAERVTEEIEANAVAKREATAKALHLLKRTLSAVQSEELAAQGYFHVSTKDGGTYRLYLSAGHNVEKIQDGKPVKRFCLVTKVAVPTPDKVLAQKLLLEGDPETFLKTANAYALT